jgi:alkanesulfonate monooxygenase SsuD/methylene tetrahydromethanopterin reductase-like flavin-dependent oxidoreductase (luciferase family)
MRKEAFVGTPEHVGNRLRNLADQPGLDELVILTWTHELAARKRSYELFAKAFEIA